MAQTETTINVSGGVATVYREMCEKYNGESWIDNFTCVFEFAELCGKRAYSGGLNKGYHEAIMMQKSYYKKEMKKRFKSRSYRIAADYLDEHPSATASELQEALQITTREANKLHSMYQYV